MKNIRIALAVTRAPLGENRYNLERTAAWTDRACRQGASLICFPELNLTGYSNHGDILRAAEPIPGPMSRGIEAIARSSGMVILAGMAERGPAGEIFATHLVARPSGPLETYRKTHLGPPEKKIFSPGNNIPVFSCFEDAFFGIQLCYDAHFPELTTRMALDGADIVFIPHASPRGVATQKHLSWMRHLPARAYDNGVFIAAVNQVGDNGKGLQFPGNAVAISPAGEVMATVLSGGEELLTVDFAAKDLRHVRDHRMRYFLPNRRPELYGRV